jgi:Flp pilus assembly protein TadD
LVVAAALLVRGLTEGAIEAQVSLGALGAALAVLAVVLTRLEGPLKIGPGGVQAQLARRKVMSEYLAVREQLDANDLDLVTVATGERSLAEVPQAGRIRNQVASLVETVERIDSAIEDREELVPPEALLEIARGLMAANDWAEAAKYFDRYTEIKPTDWKAQFSRGVAYANSRQGPESDVAALRAYNDAIALHPANIDPNLVARLHSYRGAIFKRLGRLAEAEADLRLAQGMATHTDERNDINYNLACVFAMTDRRDESLNLVRSLRGTKYVGAIRANLHRYFEAMADDAELLALLDE